jgi:hypothetical protein
MRALIVVSCAIVLLSPSRVARGQGKLVELDHVFVVVSPGAKAEIAALRAAGLTLDTEPSKHPGQGTASISALFENAYLELIWVDSTVRVDPELAAVHAWFRRATAWRTTGVSPFGLGLRRRPGVTAELPVPVTRQSAPWLTPGTAYELLHQTSDSLAADFFVLPTDRAVPSWIARFRQRMPAQLQHRSGVRRITRVRVHGPPSHQPTAFSTLRPTPVEFVSSAAALLEVYLDAGTRRQRVDLRPALPIVMWID